jgi:hypothetical protein
LSGCAGDFRPRHTRVRVRDVIYFLNIGQEAPSGVEAR